MHTGCSGSFDNGKILVDKIRTMGFATKPMPMSLNIECKECGQEFEMECHEGKCLNCNMVYGVTPCHASDPDSVVPAGKDY